MPRLFLYIGTFEIKIDQNEREKKKVFLLLQMTVLSDLLINTLAFGS